MRQGGETVGANFGADMVRRIEDDVFDADGLLRDGAVVRTSMMLRDGLTPLQRAVMDAKRKRKPDEECDEEEDACLGPPEQQGTSKKDAAMVVDANGEVIGLHSPGWRQLSTVSAVDHARQVTADKIRGDARRDYIRDTALAYQRKADASEYTGSTGRYSVYTGQPTRAIPRATHTNSGVWRPETAKEGARCTINGRGGKLPRDGEGNLVCVPDGSTDAAPPRFMDAGSAQLIRDAAADEAAREQAEAWRKR